MFTLDSTELTAFPYDTVDVTLTVWDDGGAVAAARVSAPVSGLPQVPVLTSTLGLPGGRLQANDTLLIDLVDPAFSAATLRQRTIVCVVHRTGQLRDLESGSAFPMSGAHEIAAVATMTPTPTFFNGILEVQSGQLIVVDLHASDNRHLVGRVPVITHAEAIPYTAATAEPFDRVRFVGSAFGGSVSFAIAGTTVSVPTTATGRLARQTWRCSWARGDGGRFASILVTNDRRGQQPLGRGNEPSSSDLPTLSSRDCGHSGARLPKGNRRSEGADHVTRRFVCAHSGIGASTVRPSIVMRRACRWSVAAGAPPYSGSPTSGAPRNASPARI